MIKCKLQWKKGVQGWYADVDGLRGFYCWVGRHGSRWTVDVRLGGESTIMLSQRTRLAAQRAAEAYVRSLLRQWARAFR